MRQASTRAALVCAVGAALAGCGEAVDVPPLGDYTTWQRFDIRGPAPGHGDSYRIIYANDIATTLGPTQIGYAEGAVLVKEIRDDDDGQPGALRYLAIMRRVGGTVVAQANEGGWVFTMADDAAAEELHFDYCWGRCHVAAPYHGAWYDYRQLPPP